MTDYLLVRVTSESAEDFRKVRRALHDLSTETGIALADVPVVQGRKVALYEATARLFDRGMRATSRGAS